MTAAIEARGLSKSFDGKQAVRDVSVCVERGAIYGFLGQNGAGKTTTLRMLLGIIEPDSGERFLLGHDRPLDAAPRVGYLPEERGLYPAMTTRDAIAYMGALRGLPLAEGRRRATALLERHGLGRETGARIRTLSKGMAQKVQLLATLVHQPDLIVLDEPFSGLDPVNQLALEQIIRDEQARGATVLFSTHVMAHAERLCDGLIIIANGETRFQGSVDAARRRLPAIVRLATERPVPSGLVPAHAETAPLTYRFALPEGGIEPVLRALINAQVGIRELHVERPTLHDAFVDIVGLGAHAELPMDAAA